MKELCIIGIGSSFGGDRVGWDAIAAIEKSDLLKQYVAGQVKTFRCRQPMSGLLPLLEEASAAILIDAMQSGAPAGTVRRINPDTLKVGSEKMSSHRLGIAESLALGRTLGLLPHTLIVYGIEMAVSDAGDGPQNVGIPTLVEKIAADVQRLLRRDPG